MWCNHEWGKWRLVLKSFHNYGGIFSGNKYLGVSYENWQRRSCTKCGKIQEEKISKD